MATKRQRQLSNFYKFTYLLLIPVGTDVKHFYGIVDWNVFVKVKLPTKPTTELI